MTDSSLKALKVRADGAIGPITLGAIRHTIKLHGSAALITTLCARRLSFLRRLSTFSIFGRGWSRRVADVRKTALTMAGADPQIIISHKRRNLMDILSGYKTYITGALMLIAGIAQSLGADIPGFDGHSAGQLIMEGFAIVFLRKGLKAEIDNA